MHGANRECGEERTPERHSTQKRGGGPTPGRSFSEGQQDDDEPDRREHQSPDVEAAMVSVADVAEEPGREGHGEDADGDVDHEQPAPTHVGGEVATEHGADRGCRHRGNAPDPQGPTAPVRFEQLEDHRHPDRQERSAAKSLHDAATDEDAQGRRERAEQRTDREQGEADDEDVLLSETVCEPARRRHRHADREQVGGDDPLDAGEGPELVADPGQRERSRSKYRGPP